MKPIRFLSLFCLLSAIWSLSCRPSKSASEEVSLGKQAFDRRDYTTALKVFLPLARHGDPVAQDYLGILYENGQGVSRDYKEAANWYRMAAKQGYSDAQENLGSLYDNGRGVPQDYKEAARWYRIAADQGDPEAQIILGFDYENGRGVPQDYKEAAKWYRLAAEQGKSNAQNVLGIDYEHGLGVPKDDIQAHMWYNLSAANGWAKGAINRDRIAQELTPEQLAEAQRLALEWRPKSTKSLTFDVSEIDATPAPTATPHQMGESSETEPVKVRASDWFTSNAPNAATQELTPVQLAEAQRRALEWKPKDSKFLKFDGAEVSASPAPPSTTPNPATPPIPPRAPSTGPWTVVERVQSIQEAEARGLVRTSYRSLEGSSSGDSIILIVVKINGPAKLVLSIPPGLTLNSPSPSSQSMVISGLKGLDGGNGKYEPEQFVTLTDDKPARYVIEAYCAEFHKDNPSADKSDFQIAETADPVLACILNGARKDGLSVQGTQAAVWIHTDRIAFQEMNTRMAVGQREWSKAEIVASRCISSK